MPAIVERSISGTVSVYGPPYTGASLASMTPIATINTGSPLAAAALAVDANANLFVAVASLNKVLEYAPPYTGAPIATITNGINQPSQLAIAAAAPAATLTLQQATTTDTKSVTVNYTVVNSGLAAIHFDVYRGDKTVITTPSAGKLIGAADLSSTANPTLLQPGSQTFTLRVPTLTPDTSNEYVAVLATYGNAQTSQTYFRKFMLAALAHGFDREPLVHDKTLGLLGGLAVDPWEAQMAASLQANDGYDDSIQFDWMDRCAKYKPGLAEKAGVDLAAQVRKWQTMNVSHPGDVVDLHFIGHSRGTVVVTQAIMKLNLVL